MNDAFLGSVSQPRPDPGGGSVAAHTGLLAAALLEKVVRLEAGRSAHATDRACWEQMLDDISTLQEDLLRLREADVLAYDGLARTLRAGKDHPDFVPALEATVECPFRIMEACARVLRVLRDVRTRCLKHLVPDLQVAAELLSAGIRGAFHISMANTPLFLEEARSVRQTQTLCAALDQSEAELRALGETGQTQASISRSSLPWERSGCW
ncbi:MAG: cyclodeaminase/cyclohydrolase family protein [Deltaproteobacteria bacterium]|nr:cyclodeaminase/cyclohydrolase family protein [Deltaproteobacteria bacterium]